MYGPDGQQIAFDDDGGAGLATKIEFTANKSGVYHFGVSAYGGWQTGSYVVAVGSDSESLLPIPPLSPAVMPQPLPYSVDAVFANSGDDISQLPVPLP